MSIIVDTHDDPDFVEEEYDETIARKPFQYGTYDEMLTPMAVHQCNVCNKIFMSYKGLQQHSVIHTDTKPYICDVCGRGFRFKSNMFEHRTVHTGYTPHLCPFCGKQFRLKGNMKKHMRVHVTNKEELEAAYRPYSSNRRSSAIIPDNALVIRGSPMPFYSQDKRRGNVKLQLGKDPTKWVNMICHNELLPSTPFSDKLNRASLRLIGNHTYSSIMDDAKGLEFEIYHCPLCKCACSGREDCEIHLWSQHGKKPEDLNTEGAHYCEKCMRTFTTVGMFLQHQSYHSRVQLMIRNREIDCFQTSPEINISELCYNMLSNRESEEQKPFPTIKTVFSSAETTLNDPGAISLSIDNELSNNNSLENSVDSTALSF